jgi:serum/glucocorticoid-regulated kinase 2
VLGQGSFGKVYLVAHKQTKKIYAMKSIRKDVVIEHEQLDNLRLEKLILLSVDHPFLVGMEYVFQKESRIYFLMNFVKGGELFKHLTDVRRFDEERAKFYGA